MQIRAVLDDYRLAPVLHVGRPAMISTSRTIFVADDDPVLLRGLDLALTGRGYAVRTAPSGPDLLLLLESERPDLLVMDVMMPGMSGLELLARIRRDDRWSDVPVMLVTALPDATVMASARADGAQDVIAKPFRLVELLDRIERRLDDAGAATQG